MNVTYNSRSELNTSAYHVGKRRNSLHMTVRVLIESHTRWFYPGASTSNDSGRVSSEIGSILRCENKIPGTRFRLVIRHQAHDMHMACPANLNDDLSMFASEIHQLWRTVAKLNVKVYENNDVNVNILNILNDINDNSRSRRVLHICNAINGGDGHPYWKFGAKSFLFNATMIRIFRNSRTGHFFSAIEEETHHWRFINWIYSQYFDVKFNYCWTWNESRCHLWLCMTFLFSSNGMWSNVSLLMWAVTMSAILPFESFEFFAGREGG